MHSVIFTEAVTDFNPRTREGCDGSGDVQDPAPGNFNPRTREGCDQGGKFIGRFYSHFNPRTREGCDTNAAVLSFKNGFQSTHREGCDLLRIVQSNYFSNFNPRTREGCDGYKFSSIKPGSGFQSTHPRGVRPGRQIGRCILQIRFQSTHPRGVRRAGNDEKINLRSISIHAPARGATAIFTNFSFFLQLFYQSSVHFFNSHDALFFNSYTRAFFCVFFQCESPGDFLYAYDSHQKNRLIKSMSDLQQFLGLHQYVPLWFYICFPDNRTSGYLHFHQ